METNREPGWERPCAGCCSPSAARRVQVWSPETFGAGGAAERERAANQAAGRRGSEPPGLVVIAGWRVKVTRMFPGG